MALHLHGGVKVADAFVERRRAFEIGEQQGHIANRDSLRGADDLRTEIVAERLGHACPTGTACT